MRFTADHAFHIGSQHLRGGMPCQDYALSESYKDGNSYAVVSDGCSTGGKTDVGARIIAHTTAMGLSQDDVDGHDFNQLCAKSDRQIASYLGLGFSDLLATCLYIKASSAVPHVYLRIIGDGVVASRRRDGSLGMVRLDWANNMPAYRAYYSDHHEAFLKAQNGADPIAMLSHHYRDKADQSGTSWQITLTDGYHAVRGNGFFEETSRVTEAAVFSDGVTQIDGMDWRDVVAELMNFKSTEGDFVKRRMNRFLKDCLAHGKGPIDDISMACIHIDHEAA